MRAFVTGGGGFIGLALARQLRERGDEVRALVRTTARAGALEEIDACRPWLDAELRRVEPRAIVCLGATAAQALIDRSFRVTRQHGVLQPSGLGPPIAATVHPSSVLRSIDSESRKAAYAGLVADLRSIAAAVRG